MNTTYLDGYLGEHRRSRRISSVPLRAGWGEMKGEWECCWRNRWSGFGAVQGRSNAYLPHPVLRRADHGLGTFCYRLRLPGPRCASPITHHPKTGTYALRRTFNCSQCPPFGQSIPLHVALCGVGKENNKWFCNEPLSAYLIGSSQHLAHQP
jgi:hypothetical protein